MDTVVCQFRTALAGFHREDVLNYITQTFQAQSCEIEKLQKEVERERKARLKAEKRLHGRSGQELSEADFGQDGMEGDSSAWNQLQENLAQAEQELAQIQAEIAWKQNQLEETARHYEELKERMASMEREAHHTSQTIVEEARCQAEAIRTDARQWLEGVVGYYNGLWREAAEMSGHAQIIQDMLEQARLVDGQLAGLKERSGVE